MNENPNKLINSNSELFGGCRHKTRFHRYTMNGDIQSSTDDGLVPERVNMNYWWTNTPILPTIDGVPICPTVNSNVTPEGGTLIEV